MLRHYSHHGPIVVADYTSHDPIFLSLLALTSSVAVVHIAGDNGGGDDGLTHILIYVHEKFNGTNATVASVVQSPLGTNSSFGSIGVVDDELRVGPNRSSPLVGRYQGVVIGTSLEVGTGYLTCITLVFTAGEYAGSTLSVQGPVLGFTGTIERAVVGGTGKFRLARGYMLFEIISKPTPETFAGDINLFVLMHQAGKY
nr:unnamed protein product [Digitaria exilis]